MRYARGADGWLEQWRRDDRPCVIAARAQLHERIWAAGKRALQARLQQWEQGDQAGVLTRWARDRERRKAERVAEATERRATGVGGRDDLAQLRDCVGIGAFGRAMRQLNSNGVADALRPADGGLPVRVRTRNRALNTRCLAPRI